MFILASRPLRIFLPACLALGVLAGGGALVLSRGPDFEVVFVREASSELPVGLVERSLNFPSNWPQWFHDLKEARVVDADDRPVGTREQPVAAGNRVKLWIEPRTKQWRRFELVTEVVSFTSDRELTLRVIKDSKGRLQRAFSQLIWKIEIQSQPGGRALIRGTATAVTATASSRLSGRLLPRILMNQAFYPNPQALAGLSSELANNPLLPSQ